MSKSSLLDLIESELNATEAEADTGLSREARGLVNRLRDIVADRRAEESTFEAFGTWAEVLDDVRARREAFIVLPGEPFPKHFAAIVRDESVHTASRGYIPPASRGAETLPFFRKPKSVSLDGEAVGDSTGDSVGDLKEGEEFSYPVVGGGFSVAQAQAKIDEWEKEVDEEEAREFKRELFMRLLLSKGGNEMQWCWETVRKAWTDKPEDC